MKRTDLSSTDDSTLEMNQSECEELRDLLALLETFCEHVFKPRCIDMLDQLTTPPNFSFFQCMLGLAANP